MAKTCGVVKWVKRWQRCAGRALAKLSLGARLSISCAALLLCAMVYVSMSKPKIDQAAYQPLLATIAKGESRGNYNAYFGNVANNQTRFTDMSVAQVLQWQSEYVASGSVSSAVGKYQIIRPTLQGLVHELGIDTNQRFDPQMQDRLAIALLERRGSLDFADNKLTPTQFAANLAKEWAALPRLTGPNPSESYYASDGVNKAHISIDEMLRVVQSLKKSS